MSEPPLHDVRCDAGLQQKRRRCVTHSVELDYPYTGGKDHALELPLSGWSGNLRESLRPCRWPPLLREHEPPVVVDVSVRHLQFRTGWGECADYGAAQRPTIHPAIAPKMTPVPMIGAYAFVMMASGRSTMPIPRPRTLPKAIRFMGPNSTVFRGYASEGALDDYLFPYGIIRCPPSRSHFWTKSHRTDRTEEPCGTSSARIRRQCAQWTRSSGRASN